MDMDQLRLRFSHTELTSSMRTLIFRTLYLRDILCPAFRSALLTTRCGQYLLVSRVRLFLVARALCLDTSICPSLPEINSYLTPSLAHRELCTAVAIGVGYAMMDCCSATVVWKETR